jgi:hypothetical protein
MGSSKRCRKPLSLIIYGYRLLRIESFLKSDAQSVALTENVIGMRLFQSHIQEDPCSDGPCRVNSQTECLFFFAEGLELIHCL